MRVFKDNEELKSCIVDGVININDSIECNFNINVEADINAYDINAYDIKANEINASNINAWNIKANEINANNINANEINANNIKANDIKSIDITARDISYHAFCIAYNNIKCESIKGWRQNSFHKCLDGELTIKEKLKEITVKGNKIMLSLSEINELKNQLK